MAELLMRAAAQVGMSFSGGRRLSNHHSCRGCSGAGLGAAVLPSQPGRALLQPGPLCVLLSPCVSTPGCCRGFPAQGTP